MLPADRLPFTLHDFTRIVWASAPAREAWAPRISRITAAWDAIERLSVVDGVRPSCLQSVAPDRLPGLTMEMAAHGLVVLPLERQGAGETYSASARAAVDGAPWNYRVAITRGTKLAQLWLKAWTAGDDATIGELLGFPPCCQDFFQRTWKAGSVDPTGHMSGYQSRDGDVDQNTAHSDFGNPLLRWLGVRLVPHMPCSFACAPSISLGRQLADVGRRHGFETEIDWMLHMLSWPIEWSALHGVAEIKTPVLKICTRTDATATKVVIRRKGTSYPAEGSTGNVFPYQRPAHVISIASLRRNKPADEAGIHTASPPAPIANSTEWTDNGFSSRAAMDVAHAVVLEALRGYPPAATVLDLGCGNGALLRKVADNFGCDVIGVEIDEARAERGQALGTRIVCGFITNTKIWVPVDVNEQQFGVAIIAVRRLAEIPALAQHRVFDALRRRAMAVLFYSYDSDVPLTIVEPLAATAGHRVSWHGWQHTHPDGIQAAVAWLEDL